jgi:mRNA interferase RelE/StbE
MAYQLRIARRALKTLERLPQDARSAVKTALDALTEDPFGGDVKALTGEWKGFYRRRVGRYRILYTVDTKARIVSVESVAHRKDAY